MASSEIKVGAVTLGGAAILAGIITFMGAFSVGKHGYDLQIDYPQVSGLMTGNMVRYAGVKVGTVKQVNVAPDKVEVIAEIDDNIKIPQGAKFSIGSDGLMGEKFVDVQPPTKFDQGVINPGSTVQGRSGGGMDDFFNSADDLMDKLNRIATAVDNVLGDQEVQKSLREGVITSRDISNNLNIFSKVMADAAVDNQRDFAIMIGQIVELSKRMNNVVMHMESIMEGADKNGETGRNIAKIAEHLATTSESVENVVKVLETFATGHETEKALKDTLYHTKSASEKADRMLGIISDAKLHADVGRSVKRGPGKAWRGNLGVEFDPTPNNYIYTGVYDIGNTNKFDFIAGQRLGDGSVSLGAMQGEFGVGLSYDIGNVFRIYSQAYDFNDTKVRLGGEINVTDNVAVYGESMNLRGSRRDTYVGMRSRF
ncbi:MAG: MlaD family protein [Phascolarctobacterium sp.]|nr:MlaD family protein [Phascolarctobacterium sp.]